MTARLEWVLAGELKQFADFTTQPGAPFGAMLGGAIHYQQSPDTRNIADVDRNTLEYTVDVSLEASGWDLYAAFIGRSDDFRSSAGDTGFDDFAVVVQGGFRIQEKWEPYARYEAFFFDSDRGFSDDTHNIITAGVVHYIAGNALKINADVVIPLEDTADLLSVGILPETGMGLLGSTKDGEVLLRFQLQLLF